MKKGVIFDLDGTLVDSLGFWNHLGEEYLKYRGILDPDIDKETYNMTIEEASEYMRSKHNLPDTQGYIRMQINCLIEEQYFKKLKLNDGVEEFVEFLYAHGYKLIVATDTPKPLAQAVLKRCGIGDYFVDVITTIKVKKGKDFPDVYDYCCLRLGMHKDEVVVFEDEMGPIKTLEASAYDVVGYGEGLETNYKVKSFRDEEAYRIVEKLI